MSGRLKKNTYQYDSNGKYLTSYESYSEIMNKYYPGTKTPLFRNIKYEKRIHILPDNTIICKTRIGRDELLKLMRKLNDPLIITENKFHAKKEIEILNSDKIVIATFYNISIAANLLNVSSNVIHSIMKHKMDSEPRNKFGIYIRFKQ